MFQNYFNYFIFVEFVHQLLLQIPLQSGLKIFPYKFLHQILQRINFQISRSSTYLTLFHTVYYTTDTQSRAFKRCELDHLIFILYICDFHVLFCIINDAVAHKLAQRYSQLRNIWKYFIPDYHYFLCGLTLMGCEF